jgi:hypothetical protein
MWIHPQALVSMSNASFAYDEEVIVDDGRQTLEDLEDSGHDHEHAREDGEADNPSADRLFSGGRAASAGIGRPWLNASSGRALTVAPDSGAVPWEASVSERMHRSEPVEVCGLTGPPVASQAASPRRSGTSG